MENPKWHEFSALIIASTTTSSSSTGTTTAAFVWLGDVLLFPLSLSSPATCSLQCPCTHVHTRLLLCCCLHWTNKSANMNHADHYQDSVLHTCPLRCVCVCFNDAPQCVHCVLVTVCLCVLCFDVVKLMIGASALANCHHPRFATIPYLLIDQLVSLRCAALHELVKIKWTCSDSFTGVC